MTCPQKISENSALAFNSALNIFAVPPTNVSVARSFFREILPLSTITQDSPLEFRLYSDNLWTDLARVYIHFEFSIERFANARWEAITAANESIAPIQSIGQTFIQQLKVSVGNTELYNSGTLYPYKVYLTNELSYPRNVKTSFMASAGYYETNTHDDGNDSGHRARVALFAAGRHAHFLSRLDFDLGNQELYLLNNMDALFTIYRAKDAFVLQNLQDLDATIYRLFLHSAKLYVKMVDVQPSLNLAIYTQLQRQPATYAVRKTEIKSAFLTAGRTEIDHNIFSSTIPRRVTIALVSQAAFNGSLRLSPFNFQPYGLAEISVQAGGMVYPSAVPYNLSFDNGNYVRAYVDLYEALGAANSDRSFDISLGKFREGWTFFVIPLTSTLDDTCGFELLRSGTTSIRLRFSQPIPAGGVEMIVLGEFDQLVMVDFQRRVLTDSTLA